MADNDPSISNGEGITDEERRKNEYYAALEKSIRNRAIKGKIQNYRIMIFMN